MNGNRQHIDTLRRYVLNLLIFRPSEYYSIVPSSQLSSDCWISFFVLQCLGESDFLQLRFLWNVCISYIVTCTYSKFASYIQNYMFEVARFKTWLIRFVSNRLAHTNHEIPQNTLATSNMSYIRHDDSCHLHSDGEIQHWTTYF